MKKLVLALVASSVFALTPAETKADSCEPCCDPCDFSLCDLGGFELGVEFLWVKPCIDDLDFAAKVDTGSHTHIKYKGICPEWDPGVRITLGMDSFFCNWDLMAHYTYISSDDSASISGNSDIAPTLGHQSLPIRLYDYAKGKWCADYNEWDVLFGYELCPSQCHHFMPYFGVAGIVVDQELTATYQDMMVAMVNLDPDTMYKVKWQSNYWGVGLRAGTNYEYKMNDRLRIYAAANATLLAGEADGKIHYEGENDFILKDNDCCHCVPGYHLGAGILYDVCLCNYDFSVNLGYEFTQWHNFLKHRISSGETKAENGHTTSSSTRTFGYHGLSLGVAMGF